MDVHVLTYVGDLGVSYLSPITETSTEDRLQSRLPNYNSTAAGISSSRDSDTERQNQPEPPGSIAMPDQRLEGYNPLLSYNGQMAFDGWVFNDWVFDDWDYNNSNTDMQPDVQLAYDSAWTTETWFPILEMTNLIMDLSFSMSVDCSR
jgi:hypothetical protein